MQAAVGKSDLWNYEIERVKHPHRSLFDFPYVPRVRRSRRRMEDD